MQVQTKPPFHLTTTEPFHILDSSTLDYSNLEALAVLLQTSAFLAMAARHVPSIALHHGIWKAMATVQEIDEAWSCGDTPNHSYTMGGGSGIPECRRITIHYVSDGKSAVILLGRLREKSTEIGGERQPSDRWKCADDL